MRWGNDVLQTYFLYTLSLTLPTWIIIHCLLPPFPQPSFKPLSCFVSEVQHDVVSLEDLQLVTRFCISWMKNANLLFIKFIPKFSPSDFNDSPSLSLPPCVGCPLLPSSLFDSDGGRDARKSSWVQNTPLCFSSPGAQFFCFLANSKPAKEQLELSFLVKHEHKKKPLLSSALSI